MSISTMVAGDTATIGLTGRIDYACQPDFRRASLSLLEIPGLTRIILDFREVHYLDSASLGMLLLFRDKAMGQGIRVALRHTSPIVRSLLQTAKFGQIFEVLE